MSEVEWMMLEQVAVHREGGELALSERMVEGLFNHALTLRMN